MNETNPTKRETTVANFVSQLVAQGFDQEAAVEEANRLYVSAYGEDEPVVAPDPRKPKAA